MLLWSSFRFLIVILYDHSKHKQHVKYSCILNTCAYLDAESVIFAALQYDLEEEAREYIDSVHIDDDLVDKYSLPEEQQQLQEDYETEYVVEETPAQEAPPPIHSVAQTTRETPVAFVEESFEEPAKKTYASIVSKTSIVCVCLAAF